MFVSENRNVSKSKYEHKSKRDYTYEYDSMGEGIFSKIEKKLTF